MLKSVVYFGDSLLGEVEIHLKNNQFMYYMKEIRIGYFSQHSERCSPLSVLHTIATPSALCFKLETSSRTPQSDEEQLFSLHSSCLRENKTAVVPFQNEEIHLVAMPSRRNVVPYACFWGIVVAPRLYQSCLNLLNLRCLGIVFDLDETLVVAHTIKTIDDRVNAVQTKVGNETDPQRISAMVAEIKRHLDDKALLKQYIETDQVVDNGKVIKVHLEVVPALSEDQQPTFRPIIRLQEKNIILTRIDPSNQDTSVLVRLRPSWEDLRSYLIARGRKRFEVYVCTMADKDYALEMWRLLDPDSNLINSKELLERIVCVKSGYKKSLLNVFHGGICHPKMALVIDDRLKVWDERDQPRVHVVPAFAPHYAPQAEANNVIPVLCVARNVACNVRGGFFKDFDDGLLQKISDVFYEDDLAEIPSAPDVSNYLISEDDMGASSKDPLGLDGKADAEVDKRLKDMVSSSSMLSTLDPRQAVSLQPAVATIFSTLLQPTLPVIPAQVIPTQTNPFPLAVSSVKPLVNVSPVEASLQGSPAREEGEVPESELDPDTRRRLLILQHGQDTREQTSSEPPFPVRPPLQVSIPPGNPHGMWPPLEEKVSSRQQNQVVPKPIPKEVHLASDTKHFDKHVNRRPPFLRGVESSVSTDRYLHENQRPAREVHRRDDRLRLKHPIPKRRPPPVFKDEEMQLDAPIPKIEENPADVLKSIAKKCRTTVEFIPSMVSSIELRFSIEVWFNGEKIGQAEERTRKEAQRVASKLALRNLSDKFISIDAKSAHGDINKLLDTKENGFRGESKSPGYKTAPKEGLGSISSKSEPPRFVDPKQEDSKRLTSSISELKELCSTEGLALDIQDLSPLPVNPKLEGEFHAQVQIEGQVLGKGIGSTWGEAKMRAAEEALESVKSMSGQGAQSNHTLPRSPVHSSKSQKVDFPQVLQRIPSSLKYSNNTSPVS